MKRAFETLDVGDDNLKYKAGTACQPTYTIKLNVYAYGSYAE